MQENTDNKQEKIANLDVLIRQLESVTTVKKNTFLMYIEELRQNPNEESYIKLKNLLQSIQPLLCTMTSKVALFESDCVIRNQPEAPLFPAIKNDLVGQLEESTKLQIEEIDQRVIHCKYETFNRELAKQMYEINQSVDNCIGYLLDKFETFAPENSQSPTKPK